MVYKRKGGLKKALTLGMLGVMSTAMILATSPKTVSYAHNSYFVAIGIDESSLSYVPTIVYEENSFVGSNHREVELGDFSKTSSGSWGNVPTVNVTDSSTEEELKKAYEGLVPSKGDSSKALIYTFPPVHGEGTSTILGKVDANGEDEKLANRFVDNLFPALNDALNFVFTEAGIQDSISSNDFRKYSAKLANTVEGRSGSVTVGKATFTISADSPSRILDGLTKEDYIKITAPSGNSIVLPYRINKGYKGKIERTGLEGSYKKKAEADTQYLSWKHIVLQGNYNADVKAITYASMTTITKPNQLTIMITGFFTSFISGIRSMLGLYPMEDLMLNSGARSTTYFYGLMPKAWMNSAILIHIVCLMVALSLLGFSFVRMLYKRQLQTMNIGERVSLMEGFKNMILTSILLTSFYLIFVSMAHINTIFVDLFANSSNFSSYIGTTATTNTGAIGAVVINLALLVVLIYFNFFYVLRAITVALLFAIAPLCIYSLSLGGKYTQVFNNFMKELVSNIFIQTFHALCVAFFTSINSTSNMRTFEVLVVFYSFIPLTDFVRQNLFGLSSGLTSQAGNLTGMAQTMVSGAIGGVVGSSSAKGASSSSSSSFSGPVGGSNHMGSKIQSALQSREIPTNEGDSGVLSGVRNSISDGLTGKISNSELFSELGEGVNKANASVSLNSLGQKAVSGLNTARGIGSSGLMVANGLYNVSSGFGMGAIGEKGSVRAGAQGFSQVTSGFRGGANTIAGAFSDKKEMQGAGISEIYDSGESMSHLYDAKVENGNINFSNETLNSSTYKQNLQSMYDAFNGTGEYAEGKSLSSHRDKAIQRYRNQGINQIGTYKDQLIVNYDKKMGNNKNFSLRNIGEITPYKPQ